MALSIEEAEREVQSAFIRALECTKSGSTLDELETRLWMKMLALGRALVVLFLVRRVHQPRAAVYEHGGKRWVLVGGVGGKKSKTSKIGTRYGKVSFTRPVGRREDAPRTAVDLPVDRELGLCSGFSLTVVTMVVKLCAQMAFASARGTYRDMYGWSPSPRSTLRMVDALGAEARPFLEGEPPPEDDGDVLVIQVDGKGAPTISSREYKRRKRPKRSRHGRVDRHDRRARRRTHPRIRRAPGKKSKNAKVAAVGVLYTLRKTKDGHLDGPINKRCIATFESYRAMFEWLHREAVKRGYGTDKFTRTLFMADGADVLWDLQKEFFPDAEMCLDWCHVAEKLWAAGRCLHRGESKKARKQLEMWVKEQLLRLRRGSFDAVITELSAALEDTPRTGPGNKYRRKLLDKTIKHFDKHRHRMRYQRLRRLDLDIATGIVEGTVRHLVGIRLDGPGMRWGRERQEHVLQLRCILINGQWDDFARYLAQRSGLRLPAQAKPARPYDAKPVKQAA